MSSLGDTIFETRLQGPRSARKSWGPWDPLLVPTSLCVGPKYVSQGVQLLAGAPQGPWAGWTARYHRHTSTTDNTGRNIQVIAPGHPRVSPNCRNGSFGQEGKPSFGHIGDCLGQFCSKIFADKFGHSQNTYVPGPCKNTV